MKLSEAIRIGSKDTQQGIAVLYSQEDNTFCALGAACHAVAPMTDPIFDIEGHSTSYFDEFFVSHFGVDINEQIVSPNSREHYNANMSTVFWTVSRLNDQCEWTREEIADWLEEVGM